MLNYTVIGTKTQESSQCACVILPSTKEDDYYHALHNLRKKGIEQTLVFAKSIKNYHDLRKTFALLRAVLLKEDMSVGQMVDIAFHELREDWILVLWSSVNLRSIPSISQLETLGYSFYSPVIYTQEGELLPTKHDCHQERKGFFYNTCASENMTQTLFPSAFIAFYHRKSYLGVGGLSSVIQHPFWQLLDFGFKLKENNQSGCLLPSFVVSASPTLFFIDKTEDQDAALVYLLHREPRKTKYSWLHLLFFYLWFRRKFSLKFSFFRQAQCMDQRTQGAHYG